MYPSRILLSTIYVIRTSKWKPAKTSLFLFDEFSNENYVILESKILLRYITRNNICYM